MKERNYFYKWIGGVIKPEMYAKWRKCNERCAINTIQSLGLDSSSSQQWKCVMLLLRLNILFFCVSNWDCHAVAHKEGRYLIDKISCIARSREMCAHGRQMYTHIHLLLNYSSLLYIMLHFSRNHRHSAIHKYRWECNVREERTVLLSLSSSSSTTTEASQCVHKTIHLTNILYIIIIATFFYIILIFRLFFLLTRHAASHIFQFFLHKNLFFFLISSCKGEEKSSI